MKADVEETDALALMKKSSAERALGKEMLERVKLIWDENSTSIKQMVSLSNVTLREKVEHLEALLDTKLEPEIATHLYEEILKHVQEK